MLRSQIKVVIESTHQLPSEDKLPFICPIGQVLKGLKQKAVSKMGGREGLLPAYLVITVSILASHS